MYPCMKFSHFVSDYGTKFAKINMNDKNVEKSKQANSGLPLYQISVNLKNVRFWDQICPKIINEKNFKKISIKTVMHTFTKFQSI